ncbi:hypothetical protein BOW53_15465 [Solemya pervernicosa gill symbiont]|uniref:Uncharacterized protein n=2 Tax=Gammaproteobacteria incertae sedis TaxID=118884 RepID=A0A1T2L066_9GAMM|nr:hypothetical protein [Candidatus Reidiella endopervernicosa]OOZ38478.1 hypothetical protein BOW53_15465 [Solemya pervernicosa gill symbiont]QKQ28085.1 hypothetical protein HUE57_18680 [Candidatus Reidiella endopervernicosa]
MNKQANKFAYGVVGGLLLAICSFSAQAVDRYSKDSRGVIPMNAYGECWKTQYGIPPTRAVWRGTR